MTKNRVYVLGLGSIGTFTAHSLAEAACSPPVTLLLHRSNLLKSYVDNGSCIKLRTTDGKTISHTSYDIDVAGQDRWHRFEATELAGPDRTGIDIENAPEATDHIENLIVSTKAFQTVSALTPLRHRLSESSTILFLQNGSGMIEAINEQLFPDRTTRPQYITGIVWHGVSLNSPFDITHTSIAACQLGLVPRDDITTINPPLTKEANAMDNQHLHPLISILCSIPQLNATSHSYISILQIQLEKLATNAFSNPICALKDTSNAYLQTITDTRLQFFSEISGVVLKLPELQSVQGIDERFAAETLDKMIGARLDRTAKATNSMVWDLRKGRKTEIEFINGYWCRRGREVGVPTPMNDDLLQKIQQRERELGI